MLFFESKSFEEKKIWVRQVLEKISSLHGYARISSLDEAYKLPSGTINTIVSRGTLKPVLDMAITASLHFDVCLDHLLLIKDAKLESNLQDLTSVIEEGLFQAFDLQLLDINYSNIKTAAQVISQNLSQQKLAC